jgi:hypothetical protein
MEWYEIIGFIVVWFLGLYLRGKIYERDRHYNESWKSRGKR